MDLGRNSKDMTILIRIVDATGQVVDDVSVEEWSTDWNGVAGDLAMRAARYVLGRTE
jgi:protocatechuate 3,4-dioxygenase beta subunit